MPWLSDQFPGFCIIISLTIRQIRYTNIFTIAKIQYIFIIPLFHMIYVKFNTWKRPKRVVF